MATPAEDAQKAEDARKKAVQEQAAKFAVTKHELAAAVGGVGKFKKPIDSSLAQIFDEHANKPAAQSDIKIAISNVIDRALGGYETADEIEQRKVLLSKTSDTAKAVFDTDNIVPSSVDKLLDGVEKLPTLKNFSANKKARKLEVMGALQAGVAPILTAEYKGDATKTAETLKAEALEAFVKQTLSHATDGNLPKDVDNTAQFVTTNIITRDTNMRDALVTFLNDNGITGGANEAVKAAKAKINADTTIDDDIKMAQLAAIDAEQEKKRKNIIASATEQAWPQMLRQAVPDGQKLDTLISVIEDATGPLAEEKKNALKLKMDLITNNDAYGSEAWKSNQKFLKETIQHAAGGGNSLLGGTTIGGMNVGMATLGAAGVTAVTTLSELSTAAKVAIGAVAIGGALAWENGLLNGVLPGSTPAGAKPTDTKAAGAAKK